MGMLVCTMNDLVLSRRERLCAGTPSRPTASQVLCRAASRGPSELFAYGTAVRVSKL
jgi:hypothetical protein